MTRTPPRPAASAADSLVVAIDRLRRAADIPGLSVAILRNGHMAWQGAFGVRSTATAAPADSETVFDALSLSKTVVAYITMRLVDRGVITLDTSLVRIVAYPRLAGESLAVRITPRLVLSHNSGLPNSGGPHLHFEFEPGTHFSYSGEGFVLLGTALERVTGLPLNALARREVFDPLGMRHSSFVWDDALEANGALGHDEWGNPKRQHRDRLGNPAASLRTTAGDYGRFITAVLHGDGLSQASVDAMFAPRIRTEPWDARTALVDSAVERTWWGLGWGLERADGRTTVFHYGYQDASKAYVAFDRASGDGIVYMANGADGLAIAEDLVRLAVPARQWALDWLGVMRYDAPTFRVRRAIRQAFATGGVEAGWVRYQAEHRRDSTVANVDLLRSIGASLRQKPRIDLAIGLFRKLATEQPVSVEAKNDLANAYLAGGDYERTIDWSRRVLVLDSANEAARARLRWIPPMLAARRHPVSVPIGDLERYVGTYGPHSMRVEHGALVYEFEDGSIHAVRPLSTTLFGLQDRASFRMSFEPDSSGAMDFVALYQSGRREVWPRTSSP